jgi:hypothetical protein
MIIMDRKKELSIGQWKMYVVNDELYEMRVVELMNENLYLKVR